MNARTLVISALCLGGAAVLPAASPAGALAQQGGGVPITVAEQRNLLTVSASAEIQVPADELVIVLGVTTETRKDVRLAIAENNDKSAKIQAALLAAGALQQEVSTDRYSVTPVYSYPKGDRPRLEGYTVSNFVRVKTANLELAGPLVQAATEAGANDVENVSFGLADAGAHRRRAIAAATERAMGDAKAAADAAGLRLVNITSLNIDRADWSRREPFQTQGLARAGSVSSGAMPGPSLTPGNIDLSAAVTIRFEIQLQGNQWMSPAPAPVPGGHGEGGH